MRPLLRWLVFNVGFGLLPFGFSILLGLLHGEAPRFVQNAPELLFFTLMLCAIQMGESFAAPGGGNGRRGTLRDAAFCGFLLVGVITAALYGVYVQAARGMAPAGGGNACAAASPEPGRACAGWVTFQSNVFSLSVVLAVAIGIAGTAAQWIRTRRSRWKPS
jgi:hypothetical protein